MPQLATVLAILSRTRLHTTARLARQDNWESRGAWLTVVYPGRAEADSFIVSKVRSSSEAWGLFLAVLAAASSLMGPARQC